jgi:hypothetical protein
VDTTLPEDGKWLQTLKCEQVEDETDTGEREVEED